MLLPSQEFYSDKWENVKRTSKNFCITSNTLQNPGPTEWSSKITCLPTDQPHLGKLKSSHIIFSSDF